MQYKPQNEKNQMRESEYNDIILLYGRSPLTFIILCITVGFIMRERVIYMHRRIATIAVTGQGLLSLYRFASAFAWVFSTLFADRNVNGHALRHARVTAWHRCNFFTLTSLDSTGYILYILYRLAIGRSASIFTRAPIHCLT